LPLYIWNGSQYVRVDDGAGNIQIKNVVYDANKDGIIDADKIASLTRDKITDFFSSPFWDNIPDKPSEFPPEPHTHTVSDITDIEGKYTKAENGGQHIWVQSSAPTAKAVGDIWIQI